MRASPLSVIVVLVAAAGCGGKSGERVSTVSEIAAPTQASAATLPPASPTPDDWPWWRGLTFDGHSVDTAAPTTWSEDENVVWKADVPGRGHSSPCIWGERIVLATADEEANRQLLVAYDRQTGAPLWDAVVHEGGFVKTHTKNTQASSSPACDGERFFITFLNRDAIHVTAVDLDGKQLWQTEAGPFNSMYGYGASPTLYNSYVIVVGDSRKKSFMAALDRQTGKIVWRVQRPGEASFSSPVIAHIDGSDQILICGCKMTAGYDPMTGKELWRCSGPTIISSGTVTYDNERVYASGGWPDPETICVRTGGSGDVTATHLVWKNTKKFYVPSLLVHEGLLYGVTDDGIAYCYEADSGKTVWQKRLGGDFSASPILAGDRVYVPNEAGKVFVFRTGRKFEQLAENDLEDGGFASPAICGGRIYLRTNHRLYCIGVGT